ncbi:MAG: peptide deformylase [Cyanobacteria bacterium SIG28]|nr:peptide deformylase [Cyanobacteria bacterium SIG28]
MSIRKVVKYGQDSLRQPSKEVHKVSQKIRNLVQDLIDTMYSQNGVGLAAPQIGENYRVFVIDVSTGNEPLNPIVFINPKIIKKSGACLSHEGCLSFPEAYTDVRRYANVMIKALDSNGRSFVMEAKDGSLLARAIQHEFDHLDGILFVDHCVNRFEAEEVLKKFNLPSLQLEKLIDEPELAEAVDKLKEELLKKEKEKKETEANE